jgi:hypothetical protein
MTTRRKDVRPTPRSPARSAPHRRSSRCRFTSALPGSLLDAHQVGVYSPVPLPSRAMPRGGRPQAKGPKILAYDYRRGLRPVTKSCSHRFASRVDACAAVAITSNQSKRTQIDCPESLRVSGVIRVLSSERRVVLVVSSTVAACRKQPDRPLSGMALPAPAVSPT